MSKEDKKKVDNMGTTISNAIGAIDFPVDSVNGKTGAVVLDSDAVGAASKEYADGIDKKVDTLREVVSKFHSNIQETAKGEVITVSDASDLPLAGLKVFGKTVQNGIPKPDAPVPLESVGDVQIQIHPAHKTIANDTLCGIPVESGGNYTDSTGQHWICDEVDFEKGVYVQKIGKINVFEADVLDWGLGSTGTHDFRIYMELYDTESFSIRKIPAMCNKFILSEKLQLNNFMYATTDNNGWLGKSLLGFRVPDTISTVSLFKEYVGEDCEILYKLKDENPIPLTAEQLAAFAEKYGTNTIAYGKTTQNGTPTPDKPVPLVNTTDVVQSMLISTPNGLPGIPVTSGGNYTDSTGKHWICDEVDFEKGVYVQRVGKVTAEDLSGGGYDRIDNVGRTAFDIKNKAAVTPLGLSTHLPMVANYSMDSPHFYAQNAQLWVFAPVASLPEASANGIKQWIAEHNMEFIYRLAEENPIPLSAEQLAAFAALHSNYPNTNVFNDKNAGMEVKYVADTQIYVDNKFKALEAAIAKLI